MPVDDMEAVSIGEASYQLAGNYAEAFQQKVLNKGNAIEVLPSIHEGDFEQDTIEVKFPKAKDGISFPKFSLSFDYFFQEKEQGFWAIVPALAIESFGKTKETLEKHLQETIYLDFVRTKRINVVQQILTTLWFEMVNIEQSEMLLRFLTPAEVDNQSSSNEEQPLLPAVAIKRTFTKRQTYGRALEIAQLEQALQNPFNRNVLLVGTAGVGKTALVHEVVRLFKLKQVNLEFWETTASKMVKELIRDTGWQDNIALLIKELKGTNRILFIRNLMELFEVGQYEGNSLSIGSYLRTHISRGELNIIAECNEEELAEIELKNPNYTNLFHVIRLDTPIQELDEIILKKVNDVATQKKVVVDPTVIQEVIRLNQRYTPYSGFPGKPIRFMENLLMDIDPSETLNRSTVIQYFCEDTGMPTFMVDPTIPMDMVKVRHHFANNLFGQAMAVDAVADTLALVKAALNRTEKPIASFLFVGPTGVGKTELAKLLAQFMFGSRDRMIRFDMSEYSDPYALGRLIGSSYGKDGVLTAAVRRAPFCVILFDEIEKAHPKFYDLLLQMLGEGRLTDNRGKLVNFCSTIIIMTSNIGASRPAPVNIQRRNEQTDIQQHYLSAIQQHFRPELYNRVDQIIPFLPLSAETVRYVIEREIEQLKKREGIQFRPLQLNIKNEVLDYLAKIGYDEKYGARYLQRTLRDELVLPLSQQLNLQDHDDRLEIDISMQSENQVDIKVKVDPMGVDLYLEELDKIVSTDHASELRRRIHHMQDGVSYVSLLNELDILEANKKRHKNNFWKDQQAAARYYKILQLKAKTEQHTLAIENIENELSLACLGLKPYDVALEDQLETWNIQFSSLKKELCAFLRPELNRCFIKIYGIPTAPMLAFYIELLKYKQSEFNIQSIWFEENYYQDKKQQNALNVDQLPEDLYIKQVEETPSPNSWKTPQKRAILIGTEIEVEGDCVFLYYKAEAGLHRLKFSKDEDYRYLVEVNHKFSPIPDNIHRREAYRRGTPLRTIDPTTIKDIRFDIHREYDRNQLLPMLVKAMDKQFEWLLDAEVF